MKKVSVSILAILFASVSFAQNNLVSLSVGHEFMSQPNGEKALHFITTELGYRRAINKNVVLGFGSGFANCINAESGYSVTIGSFVPKFEYHFNNAFNGFYLGTNLALNTYSSSTNIGNNTIMSISKGGLTLGGRIGYALKLSNTWVADFSVNPGYDLLFSSGEKGNFTNKTSITFGYNF